MASTARNWGGRTAVSAAPLRANAGIGLEKLPWGFPEIFVISQTLFPALLLLPGAQEFRMPLRIAPYAISLLGLAWSIGRAKGLTPHPSAHWLLAALGWLALMILHPTTNSTMAGLAQTGLYLSVLAPVFWAPVLVRDPRQLMRLLIIFLVCSTINSLVGILQVYDPATWMPAEFSSVQKALRYGLSTSTYIDRAGNLAIRPPGLSDSPGAVCGAGMITGLMGLAFSLRKNLAWAYRGLALIIAGVGCAIVYLSQVRTALLIMVGMIAVYVAIIGLVQKHRSTAISALIIGTVVLLIAFWSSVPLAGDAVSTRLETLRQGDPLSVYYQAGRGAQMETAVTVLVPTYPLGAGLGRWGMMRLYFGDEANADSPAIWAELQIPAWVLDGGIVLLLFYGIALVLNSLKEIDIAWRAVDLDMQFCSSLIVAANLGVVAIIFGYTPFTSPMGIQYWFLAGALYGVAQGTGLIGNERLRSGQRRLFGLGRNGSGELRTGPLSR